MLYFHFQLGIIYILLIYFMCVKNFLERYFLGFVFMLTFGPCFCKHRVWNFSLSQNEFSFFIYRGHAPDLFPEFLNFFFIAHRVSFITSSFFLYQQYHFDSENLVLVYCGPWLSIWLDCGLLLLSSVLSSFSWDWTRWVPLW